METLEREVANVLRAGTAKTLNQTEYGGGRIINHFPPAATNAPTMLANHRFNHGAKPMTAEANGMNKRGGATGGRRRRIL